MNEITAITANDDLPQIAADPMVAMIERFATDPNADLDKLERMLEMKEKLEASHQSRAFNEAMARCQAEIPSVLKNKDNKQTNSKYADLEAIYQVAKPVLTANGLSFSTFPAPCSREGFQGVRWVIRHSEGHSESDVAEVPIDDKGMKGTVNKTTTHAFGATISYGRRYLFCMLFDIATGDDSDGNRPADTGSPISEEQWAELNQLIHDAGITEDVVCAAEKLSILAELPASKFASVKRNLAITIKNKVAA